MTAFPYDRYPGVDANYSFPPEVRQAMADSQEVMSFYATKEIVNIRDFGAQGDGVTDDAPAIQSAIGAGHNRVYVPPGTYMLGTAILLKDYTELFGAGIDISVLKLLPSADQGTWVVTNADRLTTGNTHMWLHDITCDWDISRLGGGVLVYQPGRTASGGQPDFSASRRQELLFDYSTSCCHDG